MRFGQLIHEPGGTRRLIETAVAPVLSKADLRVPLRTGYADIGEAALLFEPGQAVLVERSLVREQALLPARQEHSLELETFGAVQGHQ